MLRSVAIMAVAAASLAACGGRAASSHSVTSTAASPTTTTVTTTSTAPVHHAQINPGSLPQTHRLPSASTAAFRTEMDALWKGIASNSANAARPAFFPEDAYRQVKAIVDPTADYKARLLGEYGLDVAAAHALLGANASRSRLLEVRVPAAYAHWVDPGACYNRVGYYEVPNSRVVYSEAGQTRSFGIASMISWRGVWYVVHLGAVVRASSGGVVDDPSTGTGTSAPSPTC